jgi:protein-disulfide isomerase
MKEEGGSVNIVVISILIGIVILIVAILGFSGKEKVTLPLKFEEFTDFQCPACQSYHPVVKKLIAEFTDNLDYEFKNYPLTEIHNNAYNAALAGQAAKLQGKFNEMSDLLFANQEKLEEENLIKYAGEIPGLDVAKFTTDFKSTEVKASVDADIAEAKTRGISATPTFYINGKRVVFKESDNPEDVLRATLQEKIDLGLKQK